jgi:methyltransferase (TIGR00027 family)
MIEREPSRTAFAAASYRAVHQVLEGGRVFSDKLAVPILGVDAEALRADVAEHAARRGIRFFVVARARLAEDTVRRAVETRGVGQLIVLGAGLDTFGYRNAFGDRLRVFEVDHPETQAWKRRLGEAGIEVPASLTYAPVDFERDSLAEQLADAGIRPEMPTFFTWLGVAPYLSREAIGATLSVVAAAGEPFVSFFEPTELRVWLEALGFDRVEDLDVQAMMVRVLGECAGVAASWRSGGHLVFARRSWK